MFVESPPDACPYVGVCQPVLAAEGEADLQAYAHEVGPATGAEEVADGRGARVRFIGSDLSIQRRQG
jgi:hypothetical protein